MQAATVTGGDGHGGDSHGRQSHVPRTRFYQCPKIAIFFGCRSGKFGPQKDCESGKFGGQYDMNWIYIENWWFQLTIALVAVLSQSLMPNHQLRVRNSHWKSEVRVENCSPMHSAAECQSSANLIITFDRNKVHTSNWHHFVSLVKAIRMTYNQALTDQVMTFIRGIFKFATSLYDLKWPFRGHECQVAPSSSTVA